MKFEDALREMRMGAKITHKYLGEDVYHHTGARIQPEPSKRNLKDLEILFFGCRGSKRGHTEFQPDAVARRCRGAV